MTLSLLLLLVASVVLVLVSGVLVSASGVLVQWYKVSTNQVLDEFAAITEYLLDTLS